MKEFQEVLDEAIMVYEEVEKENKQETVMEEVDHEDLGVFADEDEPKVVDTTEIIEQIDVDLGSEDIGSMETAAREEEERQKQQAIEDEVELRATEQATTIVTEKIRAATEVLNEQNRLITKQAEQEIQERQIRLEKKIAKNKRREKVRKVKGLVYGIVIFMLLYVFWVNPTLNNGVRTVVSKTLEMFSDLVAGEEVDSNEVVKSIGDTLNLNTMEYVRVVVDEDGNVLETVVEE